MSKSSLIPLCSTFLFSFGSLSWFLPFSVYVSLLTLLLLLYTSFNCEWESSFDSWVRNQIESKVFKSIVELLSSRDDVLFGENKAIATSVSQFNRVNVRNPCNSISPVISSSCGCICKTIVVNKRCSKSITDLRLLCSHEKTRLAGVIVSKEGDEPTKTQTNNIKADK